jgi:hypothetical protein
MTSDDYRSYLLQMWRVGDDDGGWRARLENVETGERQGFASMEMLVEFLKGLGTEEGQPAKDDSKDRDG